MINIIIVLEAFELNNNHNSNNFITTKITAAKYEPNQIFIKII